MDVRLSARHAAMIARDVVLGVEVPTGPWPSETLPMALSENRGYPQIAILMGNMVRIHWNMR